MCVGRGRERTQLQKIVCLKSILTNCLAIDHASFRLQQVLFVTAFPSFFLFQVLLCRASELEAKLSRPAVVTALAVEVVAVEVIRMGKKNHERLAS